MTVTAMGIDLAKNVFQFHGVDAQGKCVLRKKLSRSQVLSFLAQTKPCLIGLEACGGANYWAREIEKLGHNVKLIAPQFVKPFVKSNKSDAADAEAICEALLRPSMRFVTPRSIAQQDVQGLHRIRSRRVTARTALSNEIRGLLGEYGVVLPVGIKKLRNSLVSLLEEALEHQKITSSGHRMFMELFEELRDLDSKIEELDHRIEEIHVRSLVSQRLTKIPGVGPLTATAIEASVGDVKTFQNGREFSAWLGLVPRQHSSGGKERLLGISKRGDPYLRTLLIHGARSTLRYIDRKAEGPRKLWLKGLIERRGMNRAVVALANKNARQMWVLMARNEEYREAA